MRNTVEAIRSGEMTANKASSIFEVTTLKDQLSWWEKNMEFSVNHWLWLPSLLLRAKQLNLGGDLAFILFEL